MDHPETSWRPLGELFVERALITASELEQAVARQAETGARLGAILVEQGLLSEPDLARALAEQVGAEVSGTEAAVLRGELEDARSELDRLRDLLADAMTAFSALLAEGTASAPLAPGSRTSAGSGAGR